MVTRAIVLIESNPIDTGLLQIKAAQRLGLHPIVLTANPVPYDYIVTEGAEAIHIDTGDLDALVRECSSLGAMHEISGITTSLEEFCGTIAKLCLHFNLPGPNPTSIERCCDKFVQRQLLSQAGVPVPAYRLAACAADAESFSAEIGLPVVLKPVVGAGSSGVRLCRDAGEVAEHAGYLLGGERISGSSRRILVEQFIPGPHYSIETMGNEVIGISAEDFGPPPHFVSREYIYPALLSKDEQKRVVEVSLSSLRALGLGWGPANIDVRRTEHGPVVIEVNPRLGGTPAPQLVQLAHGVDLVTEHIKLVIGEEWDLRKGRSHTAAAQYLLPDRDGTLEIGEASGATAEPGVAEVKFYFENKTRIVRKGDYRDKIGYVIVSSPSRARAKEMLQYAVDSINWSIVPFPILDDSDSHSRS
ncbi:acetyl-CoA carboxylase biotin carboxylase subunit family protein [Mesorhizobium sp. M0092]|uniref:ATP-grasp domain-containing protein n=1 Tax=Mesorhizobium sp. M0092 TaxID=2956876 RepID=UPI00333DBD34